MPNNSGISFFQGLVIGAVAGAVAGLLLAPKSGAETRAAIKSGAVKLQTDMQNIYNDAVAAIDKKVEALKKAGKKVDPAKYKELVDNVVAEMTDTKNLTSEEAKQLGTQLRKDSEKFVKALQA